RNELERVEGEQHLGRAIGATIVAEAVGGRLMQDERAPVREGDAQRLAISERLLGRLVADRFVRAEAADVEDSRSRKMRLDQVLDRASKRHALVVAAQSDVHGMEHVQVACRSKMLLFM